MGHHAAVCINSGVQTKILLAMREALKIGTIKGLLCCCGEKKNMKKNEVPKGESEDRLRRDEEIYRCDTAKIREIRLCIEAHILLIT